MDLGEVLRMGRCRRLDIWRLVYLISGVLEPLLRMPLVLWRRTEVVANGERWNVGA